MSTKVEQPSSHNQTTIAVSPSAVAAATGSRISMLAKKSGFVIPKNKLSGSLVPIYRGKKGSSDAASEESTKQVQRKTKWGPDLTQDTVVRKGRALAYQTRVDQISQQLGLRSFGMVENQDSSSGSFQIQAASSDYQLNSEESECLELERREAIGDILKLNPSYKAPADYKPLLKEAKVPIPIKEYPGYNFVGLIFGPLNDTQKRLEKETGAKIRVYGTKVDTGEKGEVTSDGPETHVGYEELHVHVSADTYEKVDAAVALIELLVTPVSVNPASVSTSSTIVSGDNANIVDWIQCNAAAVVSQGVVQPVESAQAVQQNNFQQYAGPWFHMGAAQISTIPSQDCIAPVNPSAPVGNPVQLSSSPINPSNMPSLFGPRPVGTAGVGLAPQNPSLLPSGPPPQLLPHPFMPQPPPRNPFMSVSLTTPSHPNLTTTSQLSANQPKLTGPPQIVRPGMSLLPQSASPATFPNQPVSSAGWSQPLGSTSSSSGPGNTMPLLQGHPPMAAQPMAGSGAQPRNLSPLPQQSAPPSAGAAVNLPMNAPSFNATSHSQIGHPLSLFPSLRSAHASSVVQSSTISIIQPGTPQVSMPVSAPNLVPGSNPVILPVASNSRPPPPLSGFPGSGGALSINPIKPPFPSAPPQQPSSSDFTFQPHRPHVPAAQVTQWPNSQPIQTESNQSIRPPQGSQTPSFQPAIVHNLNPSPIVQSFSRPHGGNLMSQPRVQSPINLASPTAHPGPLRHGTFPNPTPVSPNAISLIQPRNFTSAPPHITSTGLNPRAGGPTQIQHNYHLPGIRPQGFVAPLNHQFSSNISVRPPGRPVSNSSGAQQVYDPFSPTSASLNPQLSSNRMKMKKQENDPEYEDLMASVGVK